MLPVDRYIHNATLASQVLSSIWTDSYEALPDGGKSDTDFLFSKPSEGLYASAWAWDSAWHILGNAYVNPPRAVAELHSLFARQWQNDMVPHILYGYDPQGIYYPGAEVWGTGHSTSSVSQPPIWTFLIERAQKVIASRQPQASAEFDTAIAALLDAMNASHRFFRTHRDPLGIGAVSTAHPWENGTDNISANLMALEAITPSAIAWEQGELKAKASNVTGGDDRPGVDYYAKVFEVSRHVETVDNTNPGLFNLYDPLMTATLLYSEWALIRLANAFARPDIAAEASKRAERLTEGLAQLWDEENKRYSFINALDADAGFMQTDNLSCYIPLLCAGDPQAIPAANLRAMLAALHEKAYIREPFFGLPSASPSHEKSYHPHQYWLGPVWANLNALIETGLKEAQAVYPDWDSWQTLPAMTDAISRQCFALDECREYFSGTEYKGLGGQGFGWTAVIILDHAMRQLTDAGATDAIAQVEAVHQLNRELYALCVEKGVINKTNDDAPLLSVSTNGTRLQATIQPNIATLADHPLLARLATVLEHPVIHQERPGQLHILTASAGIAPFMNTLREL